MANDDANAADIRAMLAQILSGIADHSQRLKAVQAVQRQILLLLLKPEGRRQVNPAVLTCTEDDCPGVLACPGNECVFPIR